MSTEKGESLIGNVPGFAMAASEIERLPVPSVEEPEGADIPRKGEVTLTADNLFDRLNTCFLEP
jgi:hypothetical protein